MTAIEATDVRIRRMDGADPAVMSAAFARIGWSRSKPMSRLEQYLREQADGQREVLVAFVGTEFVGYVTLSWESRYPPFAADGVPEVEDLNVLPTFRGRGIATRLVDQAEQIAAKRSAVVGLGVGLHPGYEVAQRMYVKRGYVPDGRAVTFHDVFVEEAQSVVVNDDLVLHLVKRVRSRQRMTRTSSGRGSCGQRLARRMPISVSRPRRWWRSRVARWWR